MPSNGPTLPTARAIILAPALAACCALLAALPVTAQNTAATSTRAKAPALAAKTSKPVKPVKPASSRQQLRSEAKGLALAKATTEAISADQLDIAARVLTGAADCEFKQTVQVQPLPGKPGLFTVDHQGKRFVMAPRETSTGAVRLEDPAAGVVWLQIPAKSMLMNARIGQRMVDGCQHAEQRIAMLAVAAAGQSLGIEARSAAPEPAASASAPAAAASAAAVPAEAASAPAPLPEPVASAASAEAAASAASAASAAPAASPASAPSR